MVTIITPCYNGAKYLDRYFASLINQTFKDFKITIIDDGSSDNSVEIINSYKDKLNITLIKQEHGGQALATKKAIDILDTKYFCLLDCDDTIEPTSLEKRVKFLEENKDYAYVRTDGQVINEEGKLLYLFSNTVRNEYEEDLFLPLIKEENSYVANGCYMFNTEEYFKNNESKTIINSTGGQNWQILIPMSYKNKCGYIDEVLFTYYEISTSHSHRVKKSFDEENERNNAQKELLLKLLDNLNVNLDNVVEEKYNIKYLDLLIKHNKNKEFKKEYKKLKYNIRRFKFYNLLGVNKISKKIYSLLVSR